jgi:hypothetical protein
VQTVKEILPLARKTPDKQHFNIYTTGLHLQSPTQIITKENERRQNGFETQ